MIETDSTLSREAHPEAAAILRDAGWKPHDRWGVYTRGTLVMGFSPDGQNFDVKNWGLDIHGPDTPDDPVEAAQWLVALRTPLVILTTEATVDPLASLPEEQQSPRTYDEATDEYFAQYPEERGHEGDGETGAAPQAGTLDEGADQGDLGFIASDFASDAGGEDAPLDVLDADFTEDPLLEFGGEVLEEHPEEHGSGAFIFGDNLEQQRTVAIGIVVRISRGKQADIRALMGDADFAELQGYVLRDTIDGVYRGPPETYATFVELSRYQSAINRVKSAEADKVAFLEAAKREELEAFNPEADWPE